LTINYRNINTLFFSALLAGTLLYLFSLWVPFLPGSYDGWQKGNLFNEIRPRALLGTLAYIFDLEGHGFAMTKLISLWGWLTLIIWQIFRVLVGPAKKIESQTMLTIVCLSFIFAFSTVSQMTFGPLVFMDSVPYFLVIVAYLFFAKNEEPLITHALFCTLLLFSAIAIHEKTIFDVAILLVWLLYKKGTIKALFLIAPTYILSLIILIIIKDRKLTGESPETYLNILKKGFDFFVEYSFDLTAIAIGGGALWILYGILSYYFIRSSQTSSDRKIRIGVIVAMLLCCFAPLLVAWDTNRLVGLIWLPTFLLIVETGSVLVAKPNKLQSIGFVLLCFLQLAMPPMLRDPGLIFPYNSYAEYVFSKQPPIHQGDLLLFKDQSNGSLSLRNGWNGPESWGVWSREKEFTIIIDGVRDPLITSLTINFQAMASKKLPQFLAIYINNQLVNETTVTEFNDNTIKVLIPNTTVGALNLRFNLSNPTTPVAMGISSEDNRILGLGLISIRFE